MNLSYSMKLILPFIGVVLAALLIDFIIYLNLPKDIIKVKYIEKPVKLDKIDSNTTIVEKKVIKKVIKKNVKEKKKQFDISKDISLKVIFVDGTDSWVVVSQKNSEKTTSVNIGDIFNNYKLESVFDEFAVFLRDGVKYKIYLINNKTKFEILDSVQDNRNLDNIKSNEMDTKVKFSKYIESNIDDTKEVVKVNKVLINSYKKDFTKIWDEINIKEIKESGKINGFKINNILSQSVFNKLGLKKNDIIKSVNGIKIKSYMDAFKIYNNIDTIKTINIGIIRDNKNMELKYEVK